MKRAEKVLEAGLCAVLAATILAGCCTSGRNVTVKMPLQEFAADPGATVRLEVAPRLWAEGGFNYQWLSNSMPIEGETNWTLVLHDVTSDNGATYQCMVYRTVPPDTNYTAEIVLSVNPERSQFRPFVITPPVQGSLKPGHTIAYATNCAPTNYQAYVCFLSPSSLKWWGPAQKSISCTATDVSQSVVNRARYDAEVVVTEMKPVGNGKYECVDHCGNRGANSLVTFPVTTGGYYLFNLYEFNTNTQPALIPNQTMLYINFTRGW